MMKRTIVSILLSTIVTTSNVLLTSGFWIHGGGMRDRSLMAADHCRVPTPSTYSFIQSADTQPSQRRSRLGSIPEGQIQDEDSLLQKTGTSEEDANESDESAPRNAPVDEEDLSEVSAEELENRLIYVEAIEERNRAQIYSFIDEADQWESMDESDRQLLLCKDAVLCELERRISTDTTTVEG